LRGLGSGGPSAHASADRHSDCLGGADRGVFGRCSRTGISRTPDSSDRTNAADRGLAGMAGCDGSWCWSGTSRHVRFAAGHATMGGGL